MNKNAFIQKGLVQKLTWLSLIWIVLYSTWVFWAFWRTLNSIDPYSTPADQWSYIYGYGYGTAGWGYGYGYGYGYGDNWDAGYPFQSPTGTTSDYTGAIVISDASTLPSTIVWTISNASSVTVQYPSSFEVTVSGLEIKVTLPTWVVITSNDGAFDLSAMDTANLTTYTLDSTESGKWAIEFWVANEKLFFSKPVKLEIPVPGYYTSTIAIKAKHFWDTAFSTAGLTNDPTATCASWVPSAWTAMASVTNQIATIYTCAASQFAAYTSSSSGWGSLGWGSGGSGIINYNPSTKTQTTSETTKVTITNDGKTLDVVNNNLNKLTFKTEKYTKAIAAINTIFIDEVAKAELVSLLIGNNKVVSDFANDYLNFLNALKSYESQTISQSELKTKLASFIKSYAAYKDALKDVASVSTKKLNNTDILVITPKFDNADASKAIDEITKRFEKYLMKKWYTGSSLKSMYNNYTSFLLGVKVMRDKGSDLWRELAKKYLWELTKQLVAKMSSK